MASETGIQVASSDGLVPLSEMQSPLTRVLAQAPAEPMRKHVKEFQPLQDQLLVRRVKEDETNESGLIWLPESGKEKPIEAVVIACGPGRFDLFGRFVPVEVHPGERVILRKYAGTEIVLRGETCLLVSQDQTLGVIR